MRLILHVESECYKIMKRIAVAAFVLVMSSTAYGMVYRWTDSVGIRHYTNKEYEIPERYRKKAKALYPESGDTAAGVLPQPAQPTIAQLVPASPPPAASEPATQKPVINKDPRKRYLDPPRIRGKHTRRYRGELDD